MVLIPESETTEVNKGLKSGFLKSLLPRVSRTEGDVVPFDPLKIRQSIVKETGLFNSMYWKMASWFRLGSKGRILLFR